MRMAKKWSYGRTKEDVEEDWRGATAGWLEVDGKAVNNFRSSAGLHDGLRQDVECGADLGVARDLVREKSSLKSAKFFMREKGAK
ncbi:hypothetical protein Droror1_Dr00026607 [Drosera rotundifolia]